MVIEPCKYFGPTEIFNDVLNSYTKKVGNTVMEEVLRGHLTQVIIEALSRNSKNLGELMERFKISPF